MTSEHLTASRVWELVRDHAELNFEESVHIAECEPCNSWLTRFAEMAKRAGFQIVFWIPPLDSTKRKAN